MPVICGCLAVQQQNVYQWFFCIVSSEILRYADILRYFVIAGHTEDIDGFDK